jgi:uncharacterized repeat protein (TIGR03837 family)
MTFQSIDLFCHVIDNFGDAGVALRCAHEFKKAHPHCTVRLFIDNLATLHAIEPSVDVACFYQTVRNVVIIDSGALAESHIDTLGIAHIVIEAFACHIPECYFERALFSARLIINIDYLSAETWTEGYHLKESLLPKGTAKKYFYMPGFTAATGGVILNSEVVASKKKGAEQGNSFIKKLLQEHAITPSISGDTLIGTVFTYERGFDALLQELELLGASACLLCFGEKSKRSIGVSLAQRGITVGDGIDISYRNIRFIFMPFIPQHDYDTLLCHTHFNIVRGEDSLVRAILAGKPFIWNAYLQDEKYQKIKVEALLLMMHHYFDDEKVFTSYRQLLINFNDAPCEAPHQTTVEEFSSFFGNLKKIELSTKKLCYFIEHNCNLIEKLSDFINAFEIE